VNILIRGDPSVTGLRNEHTVNEERGRNLCPGFQELQCGRTEEASHSRGDRYWTVNIKKSKHSVTLPVMFLPAAPLPVALLPIVSLPVVTLPVVPLPVASPSVVSLQLCIYQLCLPVAQLPVWPTCCAAANCVSASCVAAGQSISIFVVLSYFCLGLE
jgi:hypothetical protein